MDESKDKPKEISQYTLTLPARRRPHWTFFLIPVLLGLCVLCGGRTRRSRQLGKITVFGNSKQLVLFAELIDIIHLPKPASDPNRVVATQIHRLDIDTHAQVHKQQLPIGAEHTAFVTPRQQHFELYTGFPNDLQEWTDQGLQTVSEENSKLLEQLQDNTQETIISLAKESGWTLYRIYDWADELNPSLDSYNGHSTWLNHKIRIELTPQRHHKVLRLKIDQQSIAWLNTKKPKEK